MIEKAKATFVEMSVVLTVLLAISAAFGLSHWKWVLYPIPVALGIWIILHLVESTYARFRKR